MYKFIREDNRNFIPVTEEDIAEAEKALGVSFPEVLKEYYRKYNNMDIADIIIPDWKWPENEPVPFMDELDISHILPVKTDVRSEKSVQRARRKLDIDAYRDGESHPWVREGLIPFAYYDLSDYCYFWDKNDGKVYVCFEDEADPKDMMEPFYVCPSVEDFLNMMNDKGQSPYD